MKLEQLNELIGWTVMVVIVAALLAALVASYTKRRSGSLDDLPATAIKRAVDQT